MKKITIIGGGNLGLAIAGGLIASNENYGLRVTKRSVESIRYLEEKKVGLYTDNATAISNADIILLCVKPYHAKEILEKLDFTKEQILVSCVSGILIQDIITWTNATATVMRAMPNTAIINRESMTCLAGKEIPAEVTTLFQLLGKTIEIEEALMDAATVLGACATAFALRYIRATMQAGIQIGFNSAQTATIVAQTVKGAAELLLLGNNTHPEREIDKVTTPKGCTIVGLNEMEHAGFSSAVIKGVVSSFNALAKK